MSELENVKKKIHALLQKTVECGCTEEEAMAAAAKAGEMMDHYCLSISDIDIKQTGCKLVKVVLDTVIGGPLDSTTVAIAQFCDCRTWFSRGKKIYKGPITEGATYNFFGLEPDAEMAEHLYRVIEGAHQRALTAFKATDAYKATSRKKNATKSFGYAFACRISGRLDAMKRERDAALKKAEAELRADVGEDHVPLREERTGRSLVLVKQEQVESEFRDLGIRLRSRQSNVSAWNSSANSAGAAAADRVNLNPGIGNKTAGLLT